jgi:thymidylate synthase
VNKIEILKKAVSTVVAVGTAKIVKEVIENNVNTASVAQKVSVAAAGTVIGYSVSELTSDYTDRKIDEIATFIQKIKNRKNEKTSN